MERIDKRLLASPGIEAPRLRKPPKPPRLIIVASSGLRRKQLGVACSVIILAPGSGECGGGAVGHPNSSKVAITVYCEAR
jgi:hypothetical protein